jgi:hypothetical protein
MEMIHGTFPVVSLHLPLGGWNHYAMNHLVHELNNSMASYPHKTHPHANNHYFNFLLVLAQH